MKPIGQNQHVDIYIEKHPPILQEIMIVLRSIIKEAAPGAEEIYKWGQPIYDLNGIFCSIKACKKSVNLHLNWGAKLKDPNGILLGDEGNNRHVNISELQDIRRKLFVEYIQESIRLNQNEQTHASEKVIGLKFEVGSH